MKALSLKQPWAELILLGKKTIELRKWNTKFRGKFLIHASGNIDMESCTKFGFKPDDLTKQAIIGEAEITDVKKYETKEDFERDSNKHLAKGYYDVPAYGFILKNVKRMNPIPYKGKLNFFEVNL